MQPDHLILIGDFAPLTLSMLADINHAAGLSKTLHIIIQTPNHVPLPRGRTPTLFLMRCVGFRWLVNHLVLLKFIPLVVWLYLICHLIIETIRS